MFTLRQHGSRPALQEGGTVVSYRQLDELVEERRSRFGPWRQLVALEATASISSVTTLLACLRGRHPVALTPPGKPALVDRTARDLGASIVGRRRGRETVLEPVPDPVPRPDPLHPDLAVVLSTSGTTGSAKHVRLSRRNLESNARSICDYLPIEATDRAVTTLPLSYSFGLSILTTHLLSGASLLLTERSVSDDELWREFAEAGCTTFSGVPHTFEILARKGFTGADLDRLRYITQAGGRLAPDLVARMAHLGEDHGFRFFVMYGQTEATARMSYLPPDRARDRPTSIGVAIPGGSFHLVDDAGRRVTGAGRTGELVYRGPNVMMGYATDPSHLARGPELAELRTGDLARRDEEGLHYVIGRRTRFIKPFGLRIGLDEVEAHLRDQGVTAVATGDDRRLLVLARSEGSAGAVDPAAVAADLATWLSLPRQAIGVATAAELPTLDNGKVDHQAAADLVEAALARRDGGTVDEPGSSATELVRRALGLASLDPTMSYIDLGGDSLGYVSLSAELETHLGALPPDWAERPIGELDRTGPSGRTNRMETAVVVRALAISCVVIGHFGLVDYGGGASTTLLALAGLSFSRFQIPAVLDRDGPGPVLRLAARVAVPTVAYVALVQALIFEWDPLGLLLISNYRDARSNQGSEYWFIEVYVQLMLVAAAVLTSSRVRRRVRRLGPGSVLGLTAIALGVRLAGPLVYETEHLFHRVPHMLLVFFLAGWLIRVVRSASQRLLAAALLALAGATAEGAVFVTVALQVLLWLPALPVPAPLRRPTSAVAAGSLFIYLTHFQFRTLSDRLLASASPALVDVIVGVIGGWVVWKLYERLERPVLAHRALGSAEGPSRPEPATTLRP